MSERLKRFFSHGGTIAFITGFFLYIAVVLPILINDKGIFTIMGDYSSQSIPFAYHIRDCLLSGNVCWDWSSGLGSQFLGDYAYYNLFSPFSLIASMLAMYVLAGTITSSPFCITPISM